MNFDFDRVCVKSPFLQVVQNGDRAVIWHSLFGYPNIVTGETLRFLDLFRTPQTLCSQMRKGEEFDEEELQVIEELFRRSFLVSPGVDERAILKERMRAREADILNGSLVKYLELIMSEECNFRCTYCIHFKNLGISGRLKGSGKFMEFAMAKKAVDWYFIVLRGHGRRIAEINFGGGEPLLAWPVMQQVLAYCRARYGSEFELRFSINTNASLITPKIAAVLKEYGVRVASSLDGLREGNDRVRLGMDGRGTFERIVRGFTALAKAGHSPEGFAVTITDGNFREIDESIIDWAAAQGMKDVRLDVDVVGMVEISLDAVAEKLMRLRGYAAEKGIDVPGFWARPAENLNDSPLEHLVAFCGAAGGHSVCVSPSGDIFGCGYSAIKLGTVSKSDSFHAPRTPYHRFVKEHFPGEREACRGCMIEAQCGGGCNVTREFAEAAGTAKIGRTCEFYCRMTQEILLEQLRGTAA